jgi:histidinol-phosphate aminotransferase
MRRDLMGMEPYRAAVSDADSKLDTNESPFGLPEALKDKLIAWLENGENLNRYPDGGNTRLREAIAGMWKIWGVSPDMVTCGLGSDQLIDGICRVFLEPGDTVVTQSPTFSMYSLSAALNRGVTRAVPIEGDCSDAGNLVRAARESGAKIVFICSPNNPTGSAMPQKEIRFVLDSIDCVTVLDEAYADFNGSTVIPLIGEYPNLIVLRTFSKAFGLAGARVGYAIASEEIIGIMNLAKPPYNIPTISQLLAVWAAEESGSYKPRVDYIKEQRDYLFQELSKMPGIDAWRSEANFIYIKSTHDIGRILSENGVSVKNFPHDGEAYRVRISAGTRGDNEKVVETLCRELLK